MVQSVSVLMSNSTSSYLLNSSDGHRLSPPASSSASRSDNKYSVPHMRFYLRLIMLPLPLKLSPAAAGGNPESGLSSPPHKPSLPLCICSGFLLWTEYVAFDYGPRKLRFPSSGQRPELYPLLRGRTYDRTRCGSDPEKAATDLIMRDLPETEMPLCH